MNKDLKSFIKYYEKHPELRFWQALRNWGGYTKLLGEKHDPKHDIYYLQDTFYL